jgi:2'-5' RNA ligase
VCWTSLAKSTTKRLFFALWPDEQVRKQFHQLQKTLDLSAGRLVHKADLHITLQYLGQANKDQLDCAKAAASRVDGASFRLEIDSIHHWHRPRVLWAGLADMPGELHYLVRQLGEQLTTCGFPPEERRYHPHVTLARKVRNASSFQLTDVIPWVAEDFVLVASHTDGRVPRYEPVARFPFGQKKTLENK